MIFSAQNCRHGGYVQKVAHWLSSLRENHQISLTSAISSFKMHWLSHQLQSSANDKGDNREIWWKEPVAGKLSRWFRNSSIVVLNQWDTRHSGWAFQDPIYFFPRLLCLISLMPRRALFDLFNRSNLASRRGLRAVHEGKRTLSGWICIGQ